MPKAVSTTLRDRIMRTSAPESPLDLLVITHPQLVTPVRVVNDTQNLVSGGNTYTALPFRLVWPDDQESTAPRCRLAVDNVGAELMTWLEASGGGHGAQVTLMQVLPSTPNVVEISVQLDVLSITATVTEVQIELGFDNVFFKPLTRIQYRPDTHPGVF